MKPERFLHSLLFNKWVKLLQLVRESNQCVQCSNLTKEKKTSTVRQNSLVAYITINTITPMHPMEYAKVNGTELEWTCITGSSNTAGVQLNHHTKCMGVSEMGGEHKASSSYYMNSSCCWYKISCGFISKKNDYPLHATIYSGPSFLAVHSLTMAVCGHVHLSCQI